MVAIVIQTIIELVHELMWFQIQIPMVEQGVYVVIIEEGNYNKNKIK